MTHVSESRRYGSVQDRRPQRAAPSEPDGPTSILTLLPVEPAAVQEHIGRRTLNVAVAALGLVVAAPIMVIVAVLVKLTSRGPVFYTQTRVGLDQRTPGEGSENRRRSKDLGGRPFLIYKFRTMQVDAEARSGAVWATPSDPRLTPVGEFLRQYRLDEIPQLYNVLKGDMNVVGPRPERPQLFEALKESVAYYQLRQRAKPGITGLAQISQQYDGCLDDVRRKVQYDLEYLRRRSLAQDIRIMLKTVPVVLFRKGGW